MSVTLGDVILAARDRHPMFAKERTPDAVFARFLSDYQRTLVSKATQRDPNAIAATFTFPSVLPSVNTSGITLPAHRILSVTLTFTDTESITVPFMVSQDDDEAAVLPEGTYAIYLNGQTLVQGGTDSDWADVSAITARYVPEPTALATLTDTFILPDTVRPVLVARAAFMAGMRISGLPDVGPLDVSGLARTADEAESVWLNEVGSARRSRFSTIREAW